MTIEAIETYLHANAVDTEGDVFNAWDINVNDLIVRVSAATAAEFPTITEAHTAAAELITGLTGLGFDLDAKCSVGAVTVDDDPSRWRGVVNVGLQRR